MSQLELAKARARIASARRAPNTNPGVSPEAPPDMFLNPQTGQYTSRELLENHILQTAPPGAMTATMQGAARGATLGGIDEMSGYLNAAIPGEGTMAERNVYGREMARAAEGAARETNPDDMLTGEIAGAISLPVGALWQAGKGILPAMGSMATGAGMGAAYGGLSAEEGERVEGARDGGFFGAAAGLTAPLLGKLVQKVADKRVGNQAMRSAVRGARETADMRAASGASYDAFADAGVEISPDALSRLRQTVTGRLTREGLDTLPGAGSLTPGGQRIVDALTAMDNQVRAAAGQNPAVPLASIEQLRRQAGNVAQSVNPVGRATADARLGTIAVDEIDDFVRGLQEADVPIGDIGAARAALLKARELWAQASKTQLLDNVLDAQDNYLGGAASAIRNKVGTLLRNPKTARQFSDAEKAVLRKIIGGNMASRAIRMAGNGIGRQMQMLGGAGIGGLPGAVAGAITGELSSAVANRNAVRAAEIARALIANGGIRSLPTANPMIGKITETLARRAGATVPQ